MRYAEAFAEGLCRMMFASDNWSGVAPEISNALTAYGQGMTVAYGDSDLDRRVGRKLCRILWTVTKQFSG